MTERLDAIQAALLERARRFREERTRDVDSYEVFREQVEEGGFFRARWCGDGDCELKIKDDTKATIRVIEYDAADDPGPCLRCGDDAPRRAVFARAY